MIYEGVYTFVASLNGCYFNDALHVSFQIWVTVTALTNTIFRLNSRRTLNPRRPESDVRVTLIVVR
jgi:hypothetical protein